LIEEHVPENHVVHYGGTVRRRLGTEILWRRTSWRHRQRRPRLSIDRTARGKAAGGDAVRLRACRNANAQDEARSAKQTRHTVHDTITVRNMPASMWYNRWQW
jgi:hypothetical protein